MNSSLKYSVQIITNAELLTEALSLRYKTYSKVYPKFTRHCNSFYESDAFDKRSIHLGLYCENENEIKLAGYCRLILPEFFESMFSDLLIRNHPEYLNSLSTTKDPRLAMVERMPKASCKKINTYCNLLERKKISYIETSRFIVDEEHRSVSLSSFYVSSMLAIASSLKIGYVFFECQPHDMAFYKRLGFTRFKGVSIFDDAILETSQAIFGTDLTDLNTLQTSVKTLKMQLEEEKKITFRRAA